MNLEILPLNATHYTNDSKTWIDHLIVSNLGKVRLHGQFPVPGISKHDLIYLSYNLKTPRYVPKIVQFRDYKKFDLNEFLREGLNISWDSVFNGNTIDEKLSNFVNLLTDHINKHLPLKTARVTRPPAPWINECIRAKMKERDNYYAIYRRSNLVSDKERYKKLRNTVTYMLRKAKIKYYHNFLGANQDVKSRWKTLRNLGIGKTRHDLNINISLDELNNHFINLAPPLNENVKLETLNNLKTVYNAPNEQFYFSGVNPASIKQIINSLKSNACGSDNLNAKLLKLSVDVAIPAITDIINYSLMSGSFPRSWKEALIQPLAKVSSPALPGDYRPISILPTLSKVLEKVARSQIIDYLNSRNILNDYQSGFREDRSTGTALLEVIEDVRVNIDEGLVTILVLLDFSKAFDCVDHDIFLEQLRIIGFAPPTIQWFRDYLSKRRQLVISGDLRSKFKYNNRGVGQGTVLGPLVFLIYVNEVCKHIKYSKHHMYADDLQIYIKAHPSEILTIIKKLNTDLSNLNKWATSLGLQLNPSKSQCILIGSRNVINKLSQRPLPNVAINGASIPWCNSVRNLGIYLDNNLIWNTQVDYTCRKVFSSMHALKRIRELLPTNVREMLVKSLLMPLFDYCDFLFTDLNGKLLKQLQIAQNSCIRFIFDLKKFDHVSQCFPKVGILPLQSRRTLHSLVLLYKILNNNNMTRLRGNFKYLSLERARACKLLCVPKHRTSLFNKSFTVFTIRLWNQIPNEIKLCRTLRNFKSKLSDWICQNRHS